MRSQSCKGTVICDLPAPAYGSCSPDKGLASCASVCAHSRAAARAVSRHGVQGVGVRLKFIYPF